MSDIVVLLLGWPKERSKDERPVIATVACSDVAGTVAGVHRAMNELAALSDLPDWRFTVIEVTAARERVPAGRMTFHGPYSSN